MEKITDIKVRLKVSGQAVDPTTLPEALIDSMISVFQTEPDPFAVLSTFAYIFCGLKINDIKDMIILSDRSGTRTASREYIRQKIVTTFHKIQVDYRTTCGETTISPLFKSRNMDPAEVSFFKEDRIHELLKEDIEVEEPTDGNEDQEETESIQEEEESENEDWVSAQEEFSSGRANTEVPTKRSDNVNRSGYSASWLVHLRGKLHRWWEPPKQKDS